MRTEEACKQANMRTGKHANRLTDEACEEKGKSINSNKPKPVLCISLQARDREKVL